MKRLLAAAVVATALAVPASANAADPTVQAAVAAYNDLGITQLPGMPSGRTTYRTYADFNTEMAALAAANPELVAIKTAPYLSVQGREVKYVEITNNVNAKDGKPVFFYMGAIHGNETPGAENGMEFIYDVVNLSKTNPKVRALLDKVRLIDMPLVNPDGYEFKNAAGNPAPRRASCGPVTPPATCSSSGTDLNRNYPFGWGSNIGVSLAQRGSGPGSEPEVKNTMDIVQNRQVVSLLTGHTNSRALFYPGLDLAAGDTPEKNIYDELGAAMNTAANGWTTNIRRSAEDYQTTGETVDWSYYATRGIAFTLEFVGGTNQGVQGCTQALPNYLNCTTADFTGTPGPTSNASQTSTFNGKPARNIFWQDMVYASLASGHGVIKGTATPGATITVTKDITLYTAAIQSVPYPYPPGSPPPLPPIALPTHLESSMVVPATGAFTMDVNPSVRPTPAFEATQEIMGPRGFLRESWTITCTAANGTVLSTSKVIVDKGDVANVSLCTPASVGGSVPATLSLTLGAPASFGAFTPGVAKDYTAQTSANVISTAGDAALTYSDPGHLTNGSFSLPSALAIDLSKSAWMAPVSNDPVTIRFAQHIDANDALRTGSYSKTVTFTLSTTSP
jgi:Zinc carboxypeptidase